MLHLSKLNRPIFAAKSVSLFNVSNYHSLQLFSVQGLPQYAVGSTHEEVVHISSDHISYILLSAHISNYDVTTHQSSRQWIL